MLHRRRAPREEAWLLSYADLITNLLLFFVVLLTAANLSKGKMQQIAKSLSGAENPQSLESIQREIDKAIQERNLQELVRSNLSDEGLELSINSGLVFNSGEAMIRPEFEGTVKSMLEILAKYSKSYHYAVEGHTDSVPIVPGGRFNSNWDLSAARAITVRERLEAIGIQRGRVRVEGYADTRALPAEDLAGKTPDQVAAMHRRVVVRMY